MLNVFGSMSANTGFALWNNMQLLEATKENGEVITSSPGPILRTLRATSKAMVPLVTATACFALTYSAYSFSKDFVRSP